MEAPELFGRGRALERVEAALVAASRGRAQRLVIRGPAGIGRTAFLDAVAACGHGRFTIVRTAGHEAEADLPYAGLHHLLHTLTSVCPSIAGLLPDDSPLSTATKLLSSLATLSEMQPALLILDDAQWIDRASHQALVFAARRLDVESVCIMFDVRTTGLDRAEHRYDGIGEVIDLAPLSSDDAARLLNRMAPETSSLVASRLIAQSAGVPLVLTESVRALSPEQRAGNAALPPELPVEHTLEQLFGDRFAQLSDRERLAVLALCFEPLPRAEWAPVLGFLGCSLTNLDAAERFDLIDLSGTVARFRHPSIAAALRRVARAAELAEVHAALAQHFASDPLRHFHHLSRAAETPKEALLAASIDAAREAEARRGLAEAGELWEQAARLTGDDANGRETRSYLKHAVDAYVRAGASPAAERLLAELTDTASDDAERALLSAGRAFVSMWSQAVPPEEADEFLEFGLRLAATDDIGLAEQDAGRGLVTALAITSVGAAQYRRAHEISQALASAAPDSLTLDDTLIADVAAVMVGAEGAGSALRSDWAHSYPWDRIGLGMSPIPFVAITLVWLGEHGLVREIMGQHRSVVARRLGPSAEARYLTGMVEALIARADGKWAKATNEFESLERFVIETDSAGPYPFVALHHAHLLASQGKPREADELRASASERSPVWTPMMAHLDAFVAGHTRLLARDHAAAAEHFTEMRRIEAEWGLVPSGYLTGLPDAFEAAWHLGTQAGLSTDLEHYEAAAQAVGHAEMKALALRCRALEEAARDPQSAHTHQLFAEAHRQLRGAQGESREIAPQFEAARTLLLWGQVLRRARQKSEAAQKLADAERQFGALGAATLLETCLSELAACGRRRADVPESAGSSAATLTPREYEVACEVAAGSSNAEAAVRLFISERTVEFHLSQVFRKLDIRGRESLAEALGQ